MSGMISILLDPSRVVVDRANKRGSGTFGAVFNAVLDKGRQVAAKVRS